MSSFTGELIGKVQVLLQNLKCKKISKKRLTKLALSINADVIKIHNTLVDKNIAWQTGQVGSTELK